MTRTLSFRQELAIRRAGAIDLVCRAADCVDAYEPKTFRLTSDRVRHATGADDFVEFVRRLIECGLAEREFRLPDRWCPVIVMRASPDIRQLLSRAQKPRILNE